MKKQEKSSQKGKCVKMVSERAAKIVRLTLAILSVAGWVVFIVGFALVYANLEKMYRQMGNSKLEMFHMVVLYPMWVFGVTAVPTYIALFVHILGRGNNWGHVLHAILMFFNFFYLTSGGTSIFACMGFIAVEHSSISGLFTYPMRDLYIMISGSTFSVVLYWASTTIWPLFHIKRQRHPEYQELVDHSVSVSIPHPPPTHTQYYTHSYANDAPPTGYQT